MSPQTVLAISLHNQLTTLRITRYRVCNSLHVRIENRRVISDDESWELIHMWESTLVLAN
jgi:hypothetical protein